jgi:hypothetical protein
MINFVAISGIPSTTLILIIVLCFMYRRRKGKEEAARRDVFLVGKLVYKGKGIWKNEGIEK